MLLQSPSFPRRREPKFDEPSKMRATWIPAFAGTTFTSGGSYSLPATIYFICGNANSTPELAVFGQRCITALCRV
jgi:hypothetical protein